ncbi:MAG TPA: hypothetical protein PKL89_00410 [Coprothermobacter proteolyticus]|uniref:Uncharacterized protein n=1 Tax=Coprothermobacter proteolyticus (strain ATCC 35245 / DSM 5265 / OCM 4 / BT) TaxID=309798 RepID=B5Y7Y1_COPPD|nr:hypothetical protein [Coprothermobacter proteolyticus]ACI17272.1 hypothetical protein COPRO5265_0520 [Coprothermobacter proteolyticus DSM 5265]HOA64301.1 hypothetical protein [Coprothermobacter proteolyticus]HPU70051.1 hypothetical protein [Coprothermobacter proteolyticus]HPZ44575.1 hypothetical protein [Coprothermobacter proteolyticus]HQD07155.1 hypothetical protein [Coprothermobacter proteolyticus]
MNADLHVELIKEIPEPQKVSNWNDFLEGAESFMTALEARYEEEGLYFSAEMRLYSGMEAGDLIMASTLYEVELVKAKDLVLALDAWARENGFTLGEVSLEFRSEQDVVPRLNVPRLLAETGVKMEVEKGKVALVFTPGSMKDFSSLFTTVIEDLSK